MNIRAAVDDTLCFVTGAASKSPGNAPVATKRGGSNGSSRVRAFDRWFRYPAGFSSDALSAALNAIGDGDRTWLADPFAGAATTGQLAIENGWQFAGIEAHPAIAELSQLKFSRPGEPDGLRDAANELLDRAVAQSTDAEAEMVQRCFEQDILEELVGLRMAITESDSVWATHLKWALLGSLRDLASVKVGWPYQRPGIARRAPHKDVRRRFFQRVDLIAEDLTGAPAPRNSRVIQGDSRLSQSWTDAMGTRKASACVTSPPYLNNFDYADATRLEAYFWGIARSWGELCSGVRADMLTATTQQTRVRTSDEALKAFRHATKTSATIDGHIASLENERIRRGRGKEYDRILAPYFLGIGQVLSNLYRHLQPDARSVWIVGDSAPYGIYIDTPKLIADLATEVGFEFEDDLLVRDRGARWRTNGTRHQVELSERMIVLKKPNGGRRGDGVRRRLLSAVSAAEPGTSTAAGSAVI